MEEPLAVAARSFAILRNLILTAFVFLGACLVLLATIAASTGIWAASITQRPVADSVEEDIIKVFCADGRVGIERAFHMSGPDARKPFVKQSDRFFMAYLSALSHDYRIERDYRVLLLSFPYEIVAAGGFGLLAVVAFVVLRGPARRTLRAYRGRCTRCSYDLKGNLSRICPECGTPIDPKQLARLSGVNSVSTNPVNERSAIDKPP